MAAQLATAEQALLAADAALLDQVTIPQGVGLAPAVNGLNNVKNQALEWLRQWERRVDRLERGETGVDWDQGKALDVGLGGHEAFPAHVLVLYRSMVLDSWEQVLTKAEAAVVNPGQKLENLQAALQTRIEQNARWGHRRGLCDVPRDRH